MTAGPCVRLDPYRGGVISTPGRDLSLYEMSVSPDFSYRRLKIRETKVVEAQGVRR